MEAIGYRDLLRRGGDACLLENTRLTGTGVNACLTEPALKL
jgi:hypothetical protein